MIPWPDPVARGCQLRKELREAGLSDVGKKDKLVFRHQQLRALLKDEANRIALGEARRSRLEIRKEVRMAGVEAWETSYMVPALQVISPQRRGR
jgi:hypothetical protein